MKVIDFKNLNLEQTLSLNNCFKDAKNLFENTVEHLCQLNNHKSFLLSPGASRDQYNNLCFEAILQFHFLKANFPSTQGLMILNHNPYLSELTKQHSSHWKVSSPHIFSVAKNILRQAMALAVNEMQIKILSLFCSKKKPAKPIIILDIFIISSMVSDQGFKDRYYPNYENYFLNDKKYDFYYWPTFAISPKDFFKKAKSLKQVIANENFIFPQHYLSLKDYFVAFTSFITTRFDFSSYTIEGIDYAQAFKRQYLINPFHHNWIQSLLAYQSIKNLSQEKVEAYAAIDWNENQSIDFAFNLAFYQFHPKTKRFCYQSIFIDQEVNFHILPNAFELARHLCSKDFLTISPYLQKDNALSAPYLNFIEAPALRFINPKSQAIKKDPSLIAVALPISLGVSTSIIAFVEKIALTFSNITFLIKAHPSTSLSLFPKLNCLNMKFTNLSTPELLSQTRICISSNSSVCTEALLYNNSLFIVHCLNEIGQIPFPRSLLNQSSVTASFHESDLATFIENTIDTAGNPESNQDILFRNVLYI